MYKFLLILFCWITISVNAQLNVRFPFFSDTINDYYYLNYGISLCNPKDGNYEEAIKFLQNPNLKNNAKNLLYFQTLIDFQTKGKISAFEKIDNLQLEEKEKDFLKLWLFAVTKNENDFDIELEKNQKKYPNNIELEKIRIRKLLQDRNDLIYTNTNFEDISNDIDKILLSQQLSKNDEIFFKALKFDCEYYLFEDSQSMKIERTRIINEFSTLWKQNKTYFVNIYVKINFKLKSNDSKHYFELTDENEPNDEIFENYLFLIYGNPIQDIVGSDNKKYINFIQANPFYYGEWNGGFNIGELDWNKSPKKIENNNDFIVYLDKIENTINKFPGAIGPKYAYVDALIENKKIIYLLDENKYLTNFLKKIIDIFALNQQADFENQFTYFRDILKEEIPGTKFNEYYKLVFKQVKQNNESEINNYLIEVEEKFPNNKNIKKILTEFHNL